MSHVRILLIEDNEDDFVLVEDFLPANEFEVTWCSSASEARQKLAASEFDLVLLDHGLPDSNSLSFLDEIHAQGSDLPVIVLTGRDDQALAVSAVKKGAVNYLLKDEIFEHLLPALHEAYRGTQPLETPAPATPAHESRFIDRADRIYRVLLETMGEGCIVVSADGIITFVNEAIGRLVGCESNLLLGRNALDVFTAQTRERWRQSLTDSAGSSQAVHPFEGSIYHARGQQVPVLISMRNLYDNQGHYEASLVILTDISEQVRAKQELAALYQKEQEQHSRLQALIESSRDGIILIGINLDLLVINTQAIKLLGLSGQPKDWTSGSIFDAIDVLQSPALEQVLWTEIQHLQLRNYDSRCGEVEVKSRTIQWLNIAVRTNRVWLGQLLVWRDITEQRLLETTRDDLTGMMVHDLRNPLGIIWNSLEYLDELDESGLEPMTARQRKLIDRSLRGTSKMLKLVNNILNLNRLESGRVPLKLSSMAIADLVAEPLQVQAALASQKQIRLENKVPATLPPVWADAELIERVVQNLVDNAIKFTPVGGQISLTAELEEKKSASLDDPTYIRFSISDNGPGIPADMQGRVFQKFATGKQKGKGSGLGLAFCKLAVEAHKGQISVESQPGQGTKFTFTLPIVE